MKNQIILLFFFMGCQLQAMNLEQMPRDLKKTLFYLLISGDLDQDLSNITALGSVNKSFNQILHDEDFVNFLMVLMEKKKVNKSSFCAQFKTPITISWLKKYVQKNPELKQLLEQELIQSCWAQCPCCQAKPLYGNLYASIKHTLQLGINPNTKGDNNETLLGIAIAKNNKKLCDLLLHYKADLNQPSRYIINNKTYLLPPLSLAAVRNLIFIPELLIQKGAPLNAQTELGDTALIFAAWLGKYNSARCLAEAGADVDRVNKESLNALMLAAMGGHSRIVKLLIEHKAALDVQDRTGETALIMAAKNHRVRSTRFLLHAGADITIKNKNGKTARMVTSCSKIKEMLLAAEAKQKK